ncbi:MAG: cellulase family glycosylhydrolase, partial [Halieaceae bacterium]|nr:cellulase family glycosylhydrolase [Halieaceae bacterium]
DKPLQLSFGISDAPVSGAAPTPLKPLAQMNAHSASRIEAVANPPIAKTPYVATVPSNPVYDYVTSKASQAAMASVLSGQVYHWVRHALMPGVNLQAKTGATNLMAVSDAEGYFEWAGLLPADYALSPTLAANSGRVSSAISSADALAALKIAIGLNPNSDPDGSGPLRALPVSPYQLIAADLNQDGRVTSNDALAILKVAVGLSNAVAPQWRLIPQATPVWQTNNTRTTVYQNDGGPTVQFPDTTQVDFVAVLTADVNGSWVAPEGSSTLPLADFESASDAYAIPFSVWGLRDLRDIEPPSIQLLGDAVVEFEQGTAFIDPGAQVVDAQDPSVVVVVSGQVLDEPGVYVLTYTAADLAGNITQLSREVRVTAPSVDVMRFQAEDYSRALDNNSVNEGGAYRPDEAVDIEPTLDTDGGFNVGWTETGEWLEFDVQIDYASHYLLTARVAAQASGGLVRVLVNGLDVGLIGVRGTGGWQSWKSQQVDVGYLPQGLNTIRLHIETGLFNLNWVELGLGQITTMPVVGQAPTAVALSQAMGLGFNIGQVFESTDQPREFAPVRAKIDAYYALGFRTMRLPVTWSKAIGGTTLIQDMTTGAVDVDHPRLGVIKAVVDYALSLPDMIVVINAHHEEPIKTQQLWWVFEQLWSDIATIFKDRDKRLIFELLNEPHDINGSAMPAARLRSMSRLAYAQIRAIDPERVVVISGNQWASSNELALVWPDLLGIGNGLDPYLMATFHHYDPWTQFHSEDSPDKAYNYDLNTIENPMRQAQQWQTTIGANMPIFIGEWGVGWGKQWPTMDCNNIRQWYEWFPQSAQTYAMPTMLWDDGGWFGVFNYGSGRFKNNLAQCVAGDCKWTGTERFNSACYP